MVPIRRFLETQLDINKAIQGERDIPPDLTPPSIAEVAIAGNESDFANYLKGRLRKGLEIDTPEVLFAPKSFTGYRPVSLLSFEQRVAYRCIVSSVTERLDASVVSYNQFKKAPLADEGVQFIAISDVASFYQHVNQRLVEAEIVNRTGMADLAYLVTSLLSDISRSPTGLAQGYFGSKPLAELVIDIAERRLLRTGMQIWRYNDDFRIGASSWTEAHRALELLTSELSLLGMNINEHKTWIVPRDRYAELLKEAHQRLRLRFVDEDSEDDGEEEYDEASRSNEMPYDAETHAKIINELKTFNSEERAIRGGLEALVRRSVLGLALMLLTKWNKS